MKKAFRSTYFIKNLDRVSQSIDTYVSSVEMIASNRRLDPFHLTDFTLGHLDQYFDLR